MTQYQKVSVAVVFSVCCTLLAMLGMAQVPGLDIPPPYWAFGIICPALISAPVSLVLVRQASAIRLTNERLVAAQAELQRRADRDGLTGVLNRAAFYREAAAELVRGVSGCLLLADVDHFKQVNDQHGHAVGDTALMLVATALSGAIRETDLIGRMGGEEFAILLRGLPSDLGYAQAERARCAVERLSCVGVDGKTVPLSISIGVAPVLPGRSIDAALLEADQAMYAAKNRGRNRVLAAG